MSTTAMTVQDAAECLNVDPETACRIMKRGELPSSLVGGGWRFNQQTLDVWTGEQKDTAAKNAGGDP